MNTVGTLTFKLLSGFTFWAFFQLFFFQNKNNIFSAWNGDGQISRGGDSLSRQPAGFEKAALKLSVVISNLA